MSEEFEGKPQPGAEMDPPSREPPSAVGTDESPQPDPSGGGGPRRALPARTSRGARGLTEWVARTLDVVDIMADAAREALLKRRA